MNLSFTHYVDQLLLENKGKRILPFYYEEKQFWIKQPEVLSPLWQLLKPHPKQAFQEELQTLLQLTEQGAPVPKVVYHGEDFFVLEDAGESISAWMDNPNLDNNQKFALLAEVCQALIDLHQQNLVHGRPAIRDITWNKGKVKFLDFEARSKSTNRDWLIARDMIFFFDSLCREKSISNELISQSLAYYQAHCPPENWTAMMKYLTRFHWLYYVLLPFKPIAKKDLIAIYRLFELTFKGNP